MRVRRPTAPTVITAQGPKDCLIYCRVSTDDQLEGTSLDSQESRCRAYAGLKGWNVTKVYSEAVSGKTIEEREQFILALKNLKRGMVFLCVSMDRMSRSLRDTLLIADELKKKECHLACVNEQYDTSTPHGTFLYSLFASLNQLEVEQTSARVKAGLRFKKARGDSLGAPPFGYKYVEKKLEAVPEEITIIKKILELRRLGHSFNKIIRYLNDNDLKPKRKTGKWHPATISRICNTNEMDVDF